MPKKSYFQINIRDIAKMLVACIPLDFSPEDFLSHTQSIIEAIETMPKIQQAIIRAAFVYSRKVPKQERQDLFQELTLKLLESKVKDQSWAYTIARCDWLDWYKGYKVKSQYCEFSLESEVAIELGVNQVTLEVMKQDSSFIRNIANEEEVRIYTHRAFKVAQETLLGQLEYERIDNRLSAKKLWQSLPLKIKAIAEKRFAGLALSAKERQQLCRFLKGNQELITQYQQI